MHTLLNLPIPVVETVMYTHKESKCALLGHCMY
jgi:hypothetical protein